MLSTLHADMAFARRFEHALVRVLSDYVDALADLQPEANASTMRIGDGCALYLGQGTPPGPNRVVGLGMHGPVRPEDLHQAEQFYLERDLPCVIAVNPLADASLIWELAARRYVVATFRNMLGRHLSPELAETPVPVENGIEVFPVAAVDAGSWARVVGSGFAERELETPPASRLATFHCPDTVCYLARVDGVEAGGGAVTMTDGFAYIWDVGTLPSFRRRGVQQAVYRALLREAALRGCDMAGLITEVAHGSQRNAERVGFRVLFTAAAVVRTVQGSDHEIR